MNNYIIIKIKYLYYSQTNVKQLVMNGRQKMERRKARETAFELLFECEFKKNDDAAEIYRTADEIREIGYDKYLENVYFGVIDNVAEIDEIIEKRAIGWKTGRMTKVSISILRIAVYEMKFLDDIPFTVSINEAVELSKKFDDDKAPPFINGILNRVAEDLGLKGENKG